MLKGYLRGKGLRVQWERIRQSLLRTDPSGVHQRWRESIRRRKYWVPGPLALWHIDGNHKLIRYESRGGGVLPCLGYTGMCHLTGYAFCISDSETGFKTTLSPWKRVYFTLDLTLEQG